MIIHSFIVKNYRTNDIAIIVIWFPSPGPPLPRTNHGVPLSAASWPLRQVHDGLFFLLALESKALVRYPLIYLICGGDVTPSFPPRLEESRLRQKSRYFERTNELERTQWTMFSSEEGFFFA